MPMRFILAWIRISAALLLFGLLANYLYFAFLNGSSAAAGWALSLLLTAFFMCFFVYIWGWSMVRKAQKSPLDAYIEDVHKEEELVQQMATPTAPLTNADEVAAVLEKLVAANAKNTTTLNLAMENLNSRLDELEEKFIRRETAKEKSEPSFAGVKKAEAEAIVSEDEKAAPSGNFDDEFAAISDLEIMQENSENKLKEYDEVDMDKFLKDMDNNK